MEEKFVDAVSNILNQQEPSANETCLALKKLGLDSFKQFKEIGLSEQLNPTLLTGCIKNNRILNVYVPPNFLVSDLPEANIKEINVVKLFVPDMLELLRLEVSELQDENERLKQKLQEIRRREYEKSLIIKEKKKAEPNQLKNWEDELGVPLEIFLSALKDGIRVAEIEHNPTLSDWKKTNYSVQPVYNRKPSDYVNGELVRLPPRWEFRYNFHAIQGEEDYRMGYEPTIFSDYVVVSEFGKTWGIKKEDFERGGK